MSTVGLATASVERFETHKLPNKVLSLECWAPGSLVVGGVPPVFAPMAQGHVDSTQWTDGLELA